MNNYYNIDTNAHYKAIILDDGYPFFKKVVLKFGENYKCISLTHFLNSLCKRHNFDYQVRTAHIEDLKSEVTARWFETLDNMNYSSSAVQSCEEFDNLWGSNEIVDKIDLY